MFLYLIASILFIMSLRALSSPTTALKGNTYGIIGMAIACVATFLLPEVNSYAMSLIAIAIGGLIGTAMALKAKMTSLPQMVALFNGFVGLGAVLLGFAAVLNPEANGLGKELSNLTLIEIVFGNIIGAITFTGSMIAFAKLQGIIKKIIMLPAHHYINLALILLTIGCSIAFVMLDGYFEFLVIVSWLAAILGIMVVVPIGGADMPVVISVLNCYSGWAAVGVGFTMSNALLVITGALVGASGAILSYIMCKGMNRSLINVLLGGFGSENVSNAGGADYSDKTVRSGSSDDAAFLMMNASKVIIVPGYGMAVAQAQHALRALDEELTKAGVEVKYAVHPVAGRMPGHMNVLLAEANIPYEKVFALEDINGEFKTADVSYVIGANDVTNPLAKTDPTSPIYGMPILDVADSKTVLFVKRSMAQGYSGVDNPIFFDDNTMMLFGDAKKMTEDITKAIKEQS